MSKPPDYTLFKILGHPEREAILRHLMKSQATLSQLGEAFKKTPAHIRHHLKLLEQAGLVEFVEARQVQGGPEKYYRATRRAIFVHRAVLPETRGDKIALTIGSMDSGVDLLANHFSKKTGLVFTPASPPLESGRFDRSPAGFMPDEHMPSDRSQIRGIQPSIHPPPFPGPTDGVGANLSTGRRVNGTTRESTGDQISGRFGAP